MKKLISTLGLDKSAWLNYRKRGIGGSDAGAVCGFNPYRTAMEVYQDKTSKETAELDNEAMRRRREFEDYVVRRFTEATGKKVTRANAMYYDENPSYEDMAKKTVIKQALKYAPIKTDLQKVVTLDESIKESLAVDMAEVPNEVVAA